jgi:hypothetical protein
MKRGLQLLLVLTILLGGITACKTKAKRCAQFDNADSEYKLKRDRHGRVKK